MRHAYPTLFSGILLAVLALSPSPVSAEAARWGDQGDGTYRNPILWADYNNPCVIRAGDAFYLTAATHHFMGAPVLRSRDLVNWAHVGRIYDDLSRLSPDFASPGLAYSSGSQDGEIGCYRGTYYYYNWSTRYRGFMSTAKKPDGPWTPIVRLRETIGGDYEDPCPFWDDDGQAYLLLVGNPGPLRLFRLNETFDAIVDEGTTLIDDIPPKGPQVFKRDGYYYLLVARTGPHKAQFAYRSRNLRGPYEKRLLFEGRAQGMQAAQGSLVEVGGGAWAFLHHEYDMSSVYGRRLYLQPAGWRDGWPWIGEDPEGDGVGQPVGLCASYPKPDLPPDLINPAETCDEFTSLELGAQWLWNHDPDPARWSLRTRPGWLRLVASPLHTKGGYSQYPRVRVGFHEDHLLFARNTLVQRIVGRDNDTTTRLDISGMIDGQRAGLCTLIDDYTWIGIAQDAGRRRVVFVKGDPGGVSAHIEGPVVESRDIWLKLEYRAARGRLLYSLDGRTYRQRGDPDYAYTSSWYEGTKVGIFSYNLSTGPAGGAADFDFFRQAHDGPGVPLQKEEAANPSDSLRGPFHPSGL